MWLPAEEQIIRDSLAEMAGRRVAGRQVVETAAAALAEAGVVRTVSLPEILPLVPPEVQILDAEIGWGIAWPAR